MALRSRAAPLMQSGLAASTDFEWTELQAGQVAQASDTALDLLPAPDCMQAREPGICATGATSLYWCSNLAFQVLAFKDDQAFLLCLLVTLKGYRLLVTAQPLYKIALSLWHNIHFFVLPVLR